MLLIIEVARNNEVGRRGTEVAIGLSTQQSRFESNIWLQVFIEARESGFYIN